MFVCSVRSVDAHFRWADRNDRQLVAYFRQNQRELINYEAIIIKYFQSFFLFTYRNCPACKVQFFYAALCCHLWPAPLYTFPHIVLPPIASPAVHISPQCAATCRLPRSTHFPTLCCHLSPAPLYNIFPHYLTNGTIFGEKLLDIKCVFWFFSTTFVRNISDSEKNSARYCRRCT